MLTDPGACPRDVEYAEGERHCTKHGTESIPQHSQSLCFGRIPCSRGVERKPNHLHGPNCCCDTRVGVDPTSGKGAIV